MFIQLNNLKIVALLVLSINLIACGGGGGSTNNPDTDTGTVTVTDSIYVGTYSGEFFGADSGTWEFIVNSDTSVTGTLTTTTLPITIYALTGTIDAQGNVVLLSGTTADAIRCDIIITNGFVSGSWSDGTAVGNLTGIITSSSAVSGSLAVSAEFGNKVFTALNVNQLNLEPLQIVSFNNHPGNVAPTVLGFDDHILALYIDSTNKILIAVAYSFSNPVAAGEVPTSYDYQIECVADACAGINLDLAQNKVSFNNVTLPVLVFGPDELNFNIAINPATVNGSFNWN